MPGGQADAAPPGLCDGVPPREPHTRSGRDMGQESFEPVDAGRPSDDPQMQADRHHPWRPLPFAIQTLEGVDAVARKVFGQHEASPIVEAHIVGVERVGQHDMVMVADPDQQRAVVVVGVGIVKEAAVLDEEPARVEGRGRARMPPDGRAPRSGSRRLYGLADSVALALLVHVNMTFPPPAMRGDLVAVRYRFFGQPRRCGKGSSAGVEGRGDPELPEDLTDPWPPGAGPVFEVALHAEVSHALDPLDRLVDGLVRLVPGSDRKLGALLHVDHERQSQLCPAGPEDGGGMPSIP